MHQTQKNTSQIVKSSTLRDTTHGNVPKV